MIKFFRKIRKQLLTDNKFSKYLIYAIGEIVLVVIGILIALSINNWNDQKKGKEKTIHLLKQVQKELSYNINKANFVIDFYRNADSLLYRVIHKEVTYDDYRTNYDLRILITSNESVDLVSEAFKNLIDNDNPLSQQEDSLVVKLKGLFGTRKKLVDEWDIKTVSNIDNFLEKIKNEKEWYSMMMEVSDEQIDYFLNDPFYLNEVKHFELNALQLHLSTIIDFKTDALNIYEEISDYLDLKKDSFVAKNLIDYEQYLGTYELDSLYNFQISQDSNKLKWNIIAKNDTIVLLSLPIYPDSKTYCTTNRQFGQFIFDENDNVTSLILSLGSHRIEHKKIN